jgi:hypothetical protein
MESNLQIQLKPQNANAIFPRKKINLKINLKVQKTMNSQSNSEPTKPQYWRYHNTCFHIIQNSIVLAQKQTYRSVQQNRRSRKKPTQLNRYMILTKMLETYVIPKIVSLINRVGKTACSHGED